MEWTSKPTLSDIREAALRDLPPIDWDALDGPDSFSMRNMLAQYANMVPALEMEYHFAHGWVLDNNIARLKTAYGARELVLRYNAVNNVIYQATCEYDTPPEFLSGLDTIDIT